MSRAAKPRPSRSSASTYKEHTLRVHRNICELYFALPAAQLAPAHSAPSAIVGEKHTWLTFECAIEKEPFLPSPSPFASWTRWILISPKSLSVGTDDLSDDSDDSEDVGLRPGAEWMKEERERSEGIFEVSRDQQRGRKGAGGETNGAKGTRARVRDLWWRLRLVRSSQPTPRAE